MKFIQSFPNKKTGTRDDIEHQTIRLAIPNFL